MEDAHVPHNSFWNFSLRVYADADVARTCLELQDAHGADVNLVLFVLWHGCAGYRLDSAETRRMDKLVQRWREDVVRPLRGARRALKIQEAPWASVHTEQLRARIKADELEAERLQQSTLEAAFPIASVGLDERKGPRLETLSANLMSYAGVTGANLPEPLAALFCTRVLARASGAPE